MKQQPMLLCPDHFQFELEKILIAVKELHDALMGYQKFLFNKQAPTKRKATKKRKSKNAAK